MNIRKLCELITMPDEVTILIEKWNAEDYKEALERYWLLVQDNKNWNEALEEVKKILGDDKNGLKVLAFMLQTGLKTYQEYIRRGIPIEIFADTMGCFARFIKEYQESYGTYGFDREWWTVRELTLREFRLGELEYEMTEKDGSKSISVHIPSDAELKKQNCRESYQRAGCFFTEYARDYAAAEFYCESWLLSPNLKELLSESSNIIGFQKDFILDSFESEDTGFIQWVFKNDKLSLEEVPQNTSLQRKMKVFLQNGGKIGAGIGHIKRELLE